VKLTKTTRYAYKILLNDSLYVCCSVSSSLASIPVGKKTIAFASSSSRSVRVESESSLIENTTPTFNHRSGRGGRRWGYNTHFPFKPTHTHTHKNVVLYCDLLFQEYGARAVEREEGKESKQWRHQVKSWLPTLSHISRQETSLHYTLVWHSTLLQR